MEGSDPDECFTASQQQRLLELMSKRRAALAAGSLLDPVDRAELEALVDAESVDATRNAERRVRERAASSVTEEGAGLP